MENIPPILHQVEVPKGKKRKVDDKEETRALVQKAKFYCKTKMEWRDVSKYNKAKLEQYLNDQEFFEAAAITQNFSSFATDLFGFILDKFTRGGFVELEIKNDIYFT